MTKRKRRVACASAGRPSMNVCTHEWDDVGYGYLCLLCGLVDPCFEDEREYDQDDDDEDEFDCGWVRGIGCTLAGTEECSFECPHRRELEKGMALTRARLAKRATTKGVE